MIRAPTASPPPPARKVDVRLPGTGDSNSHGARPVHLIITMIKWIRTSRLRGRHPYLVLVSGERPQERGCPFPGDGGVRTSVSFL